MITFRYENYIFHENIASSKFHLNRYVKDIVTIITVIKFGFSDDKRFMLRFPCHSESAIYPRDQK